MLQKGDGDHGHRFCGSAYHINLLLASPKSYSATGRKTRSGEFWAFALVDFAIPCAAKTDRMMTYASALLLLLGMTFQSDAKSDLAAVKAADLPVYEQTSLDSPVVKTLHQGDRVSVVLGITSSGPAWCLIRETDQTKSSGYVLCAQLDRPQRSDQKRWNRTLPESSNEADRARLPEHAAAESPAMQSGVRQSLRDPEFWEDRFKFSDEQRQRSAELQKDSGITACQERVEQMYRANGITNPTSLLAAMGSIAKSASGMAQIGRLSAELDRCGAYYGSFWKKFVNLMVPEQKSQLAKEPYFILFLTQTQSDPNVEFGFYVLARMSPR